MNGKCVLVRIHACQPLASGAQTDAYFQLRYLFLRNSTSIVRHLQHEPARLQAALDADQPSFLLVAEAVRNRVFNERLQQERWNERRLRFLRDIESNLE